MNSTPPNTTQTRKLQRGRRLYVALAGLGAAALVSASALSTASAHGHRGMRGGPGGHGMMRALKHADLTEAQEAKIKAIHEKYKPVFEAHRKESMGTRKGFHALLTSENISEAQAEKLRKEFLEHQEQRSAVMRDLMLDVAKVLTPAQRKKLAQKFEARRKKWESKRGNK